MHPIVFSLGSINVYSWGFMIAIACLAYLYTSMKYAKKEGIPQEYVMDLFIYVALASVIGARVFYVIGFRDQFANDPLSIFYLNQGGLAFYGGLVFAFLAVLYYVRRHNLPLYKLLDAISPGVILGYGIGRIGCFLNGCCYGITLCGIVQPTQIYSSIAGFAIFAFVVNLYRHKKYDGHIFLVTLLLYALYRFIIEFLRYSPIHVWAFTPSQLISAGIAVIVATILWKKNSI